MCLTQLVGKSEWMRSLRATIQTVGAFSSNVLIIGPSGTGKELIARAIHECSPRSTHPLIPVDCTALSGELFASYLFGHRKGAFTGADYERMGCFRAAEKGTVLLDEIGDLCPDLQSKLLRVIQERMVVPVGSELPLPVDVRVIAATNRSLADDVRDGRFRLDLFYRLNVVVIETVPLSKQIDEIELLAVHFLEMTIREQGLPKMRFSRAATAALQAHPWPGNIRQLKNVVERTAVFASSQVIGADALRFDRQSNQTPSTADVLTPKPLAHSAEVPWSTMAENECRHVLATLAHTFYNQSAAARLLGIDRASLARKIDQYGIFVPRMPGKRIRKVQI